MTDAGSAAGPGEEPVPGGRHDRKRIALVIGLVIVGLLTACALAYGSTLLFSPRAFDVEAFDEHGQGRVIPGGALFP